MIRLRSSVVLPAVALAIAAALGSCARERSEHASRTAAARPRVISADAPALLAEIRKPGARATLVNVWATWCRPCVMEMPELLRLERDYRDRGLRVMLVSADFEAAAPDTFLASRGVDFDTFIKSGGDQAFIDSLDLRWTGALPATMVFDASGNRRAFWEGSADYQTFERAVRAVLEPEGTTRP